MCWRRAEAVVLCSLLWCAMIGMPGLALAQTQQGVTVHEWGTFTTVAGKDGRAIDWLPLSGPTDLPCFVYSFANDRLYKLLPGTRLLSYDEARASVMGKVRMETPVIYFYAPHETQLNVTVTFPRGLMTEWYPQALVVQQPITNGSARVPAVPSKLEWRNVTVAPWSKSPFPTDVAGSHYYAARATDATPLLVSGQPEKFLFYRGIADFDVPITAEVLPAASIRIRNIAGETVRAVIVFENRDGRIGYRVVGDLQQETVVAAPALNANFRSLRTELEQQLVNAGLFAREAAAMVETWRDSWFEEGTRVFYIVPQKSVDNILPLTIYPAPDRVARVFVGRMDVITPAMIDAVERSVTSDDDDVIERFGRLFEPITSRLLERSRDPALRDVIAELRRTALARYIAASSKCS